MRVKRSKHYRKLMEKLCLQFRFHEPYQVLVDSDVVSDANRFAMDLTPALTRTLHGDVKVMISQCSMRHLYARGKEPGMDKVIERAKTFERRRCGHLPEEYPEPLSNFECISKCVDPTGKGENRQRYVVASQSQELRRAMREIPGVPLIYIARSVMIMEPLSTATLDVLNKEERGKFSSEIRQTTGKRKRGSEAEDHDEPAEEGEDGRRLEEHARPEKQKMRNYGRPKGPNPLSVKSKKKTADQRQRQPRAEAVSKPPDTTETPEKKKRKRKAKAKPQVEGAAVEV